MTINMTDQFTKLEAIAVGNVDKFYFSHDQYFGPISPTGIVTFGSDIIRINALVLAEAVAGFHLPAALRKSLFDAVIVQLDENFEFTYYDPASKELGDLNVLIGNPEYSYDGTVEGAKAYFKNMGWAFDVVCYK
jgi:hypothetical protein